MGLRDWIKSDPRLKRFALWTMRCAAPVIRIAHFSAIPKYGHFLADWRRFRAAGGSASALDFYPCLFDRTASTGIDAQYFHQAVWTFKRILLSKPATHVDVGSEVNFVGLLSAVTKVTFVDIRPLKLDIANYEGIGGSIVALPFSNASVRSFSCLHVIEHIGLGRYGDPIDPAGPEKAAAEIRRVLAPGGQAYISVPLGRPRVSFNGLRVFSAPEVLTMFDGLALREMAMVDAAGKYFECVDPHTADIHEENSGGDFGLGLFLFEKRSDR